MPSLASRLQVRAFVGSDGILTGRFLDW
jgi:hypothetical protein